MAVGTTAASTSRQFTQAPSPSIKVSTSNNYLRADGFIPGATLVFRVFESPDALVTPLLELSRTVDMSGSVFVGGDEHSADLVPGNYVFASDETNQKSLILDPVTIQQFDPGADLATGTAAPGTSVFVVVGNDVVGYPASMNVTADAQGNWSADFASTFDITWDMWGSAEVYDADGDATVFHLGPTTQPPPNPYLRAFPDRDFVDGYNWTPGALVQLAIVDQAFSTTAASDGSVAFDLGGYDLRQGDGLTMTSGSTVVTHTVRQLFVTDVNLESETVSGTIDRSSESIHVFSASAERFANSDLGGAWVANFAGSGIIVPGACGGAEAWGEGGSSTTVDWCAPPPPPNPWLIAFPENDAVEAYGWPAGAGLTLSIDSQGSGGDPEFQTTGSMPADPSIGWVRMDFAGAYDLRPGDVVTVTDGATGRTHSVRNLSITGVDVQADTVSGQADAGASINVWPHGSDPSANVEVIAAADGSWVANFQGRYDIVAETGGRSQITDPAGNATAADWSAPPSPWVRAHPEWDSVDGWYWPAGANLNLTIDDPNTQASPDIERSASVPETGYDPNNDSIWFELKGVYDLKPGDTVTLTDGATTKVLLVSVLSITSVDAAGTVTGMVEPGAAVSIPTPDGGRLFATADTEGNWQIPSVPTPPGTWLIAEVNDEDGDLTSFERYISNPHFTAFPDLDYVEAWDWPLGNEVTASVNHPDTPEDPDCTASASSGHPEWDPGAIVAQIQFEGCDIRSGDSMTVSDGTTLKETTVTALAVTSMQPVENVVSGTGTPGQELNVWVHGVDSSRINTTPQADGGWGVDFDDVGYNLVPDTSGRAEQVDADGDSTAVDWYLPMPLIVAQITDNWFEVRQATPGTTLTYSVYETSSSETPLIGPEPVQVNESGAAFVGLWDHGWVIVPGNYVVVTDGETTKALTLEQVTFDVLDLSEGTLAGTAPPPFSRRVSLGMGFEGWDWGTEVTTDQAGAWFASFGGPIPLDLLVAYAQIADDDGDISEVRPALVRADIGIDIQPWSEENLIACRAPWTLLPVAVLSTNAFDAMTIKHDTVRFGKTGHEAAVVMIAGHPLKYARDVNGDGLVDMVYVFRFGDTGFSCADIPTGRHAVRVDASLTGWLPGMIEWMGGIHLEGSGTLTLVRLLGR